MCRLHGKAAWTRSARDAHVGASLTFWGQYSPQCRTGWCNHTWGFLVSNCIPAPLGFSVNTHIHTYIYTHARTHTHTRARAHTHGKARTPCCGNKTHRVEGRHVETGRHVDRNRQIETRTNAHKEVSDQTVLVLVSIPWQADRRSTHPSICSSLRTTLKNRLVVTYHAAKEQTGRYVPHT